MEGIYLKCTLSSHDFSSYIECKSSKFKQKSDFYFDLPCLMLMLWWLSHNMRGKKKKRKEIFLHLSFVEELKEALLSKMGSQVITSNWRYPSMLQQSIPSAKGLDIASRATLSLSHLVLTYPSGCIFGWHCCALSQAYLYKEPHSLFQGLAHMGWAQSVCHPLGRFLVICFS